MADLQQRCDDELHRVLQCAPEAPKLVAVDSDPGDKGARSKIGAAKAWIARSTVFAIFFAVTGFYLALTLRLTNQYVALISALHVTICGRAIAEDFKAGPRQDR